MVRGLAIRQGLLAVNAGLALVLVLVALSLVFGLIRPQFQAGGVSAPDVSKVSAPLLGGSMHSKAEYDDLMSRGLFGEAGRYKRGEKPVEAAPPEPSSEVLETTLPLTLSGTVLSRGPRELSAAIIEVKEGGAKISTFYPGDAVMENVILREVRPQEVILDNKRNNKEESLKILWANKAPGPGRAMAQAPQGRPGPAVAGARVSIVSLDRAAITKKLSEEYARVASSLNVKVVNDENGRPKGITTDNIENYEVAKELGLKNGDLLVSLNNEPIDSKDRAVEVLQKYRNASMFRVGLLRNGAMQYMTYRVK